MNKSTPHSSSHHGLLIAGVCILVLGGFGFLYSVLVGDSTGLKAWLLPFGPWLCALLGYRLLRQRRD